MSLLLAYAPVYAAVMDLAMYRIAVDDLICHISANPGSGRRAAVESILSRRLGEPDFARLLAATPGGFDKSAEKVIAEIGQFRPDINGSVADFADYARICLLAQIDTVWWGALPAFGNDPEVEHSSDLVDLGGTAAGVRYRRQSDALSTRLVRAVQRRIAPGRTPDPVGLRSSRTRPELAELLGQLAAEFARVAPTGTPPLWVTSLTRSVQHQRRLRVLGYAAMLPSAHCTGYAADIAMTWYRRHGAAATLGRLLLDRCEAGQVNVICGSQTWHVCLSPDAARELRRNLDRIGGR
jgi:hypothetical protein